MVSRQFSMISGFREGFLRSRAETTVPIRPTLEEYTPLLPPFLQSEQVLFRLSLAGTVVVTQFKGGTRGDTYSWFSAWLYLKGITIQKWRAPLWSRSWNRETVCLSSGSWGGKTHTLDLDLRAGRHTLNLDHTFCWSLYKDNGRRQGPSILLPALPLSAHPFLPWHWNLLLLDCSICRRSTEKLSLVGQGNY